MPTTRRNAAANTTSLPLDGCSISLSGKLSSFGGHTHASLETVVCNLGGKVTKSVTGDTTHVASTDADYKSNSPKVAAAKDKGLHLISPQWILDCGAQHKKIDEAAFSWTAQARPPSNGSTAATSNATNGTTTAGKKRPIDVANSTDDHKLASKKPELAKADGTKIDGTPSDEAPKEEKRFSEGQFIKKNDVSIPLDEYCNMTAYQVYVEPGSGMIWDASLNQTNAGMNNNKFYRIQIIHKPQTGPYLVWTRWGRVGEAGQNAILGNDTLAEATRVFQKKFKDKSGLSWSNRGGDPVPNKYAFVERSYNPDSDGDDDDDTHGANKQTKDDDNKPPECTLEQPIQDLMGLIFNQQYFQAAMTALNYDANKLPLGKLSKATITRGFQQLKDLAALMNDPSLATSRWNLTYGAAVEHLSNTYYSFIPHAFGRNRPPIISTDMMLKKEIELLESLSDMKDAAEIMKNDWQSRVHPMDRQFLGLGLDEMTTLDHTSNEFALLAQYLNSSRGATHNVMYGIQQIFRIERNGEKERFDKSPFANIKSDRRLLWHGSRCTNFGGILSQGLRIAPPEAPVSGYMFGKGIYLADMSSKSANYCCCGNSGGNALLLLCEAELGDPMQKLTQASYSAGEDAKRNGMASTWGQGNTGPSKWMDAGAVHGSLKGIKMPDPSAAPSATGVQGAGLFYNEYICYDVAQVRLRYLFQVKI